MKTGLVAMGTGAGVLALFGAALLLLPDPATSLGWFATQPGRDFGFVGGWSPTPPWRIWGISLLVVAVALGAFTTGWALGSGRAHRSSPSERRSRGR